MDVGLATSLEVFQSLAAEGFQLSYRRVPLSRERTPEAADLDVLNSQLQQQPEGGCACGQAEAAWVHLVGPSATSSNKLSASAVCHVLGLMTA